MYRCAATLAACRRQDNSTPTPTPTLSGCQVCANGGDCSHAFHGGPGQFCGNWLDQINQQQRCCCPLDTTCKVSDYACNCSLTPNPAPKSNGSHAGLSPAGWIGIAVGITIILACIGGCTYVARVVKRYQKRGDRPPRNAAVGAVTGFATGVVIGNVATDGFDSGGPHFDGGGGGGDYCGDSGSDSGGGGGGDFGGDF